MGWPGHGGSVRGCAGQADARAGGRSGPGTGVLHGGVELREEMGRAGRRVPWGRGSPRAGSSRCLSPTRTPPRRTPPCAPTRRRSSPTGYRPPSSSSATSTVSTSVSSRSGCATRREPTRTDCGCPTMPEDTSGNPIAPTPRASSQPLTQPMAVGRQQNTKERGSGSTGQQKPSQAERAQKQHATRSARHSVACTGIKLGTNLGPIPAGLS